MSIQTIAAVAVLVALPVISQAVPESQQAERSKGQYVAADFDYDAAVSSCSLGLHGDQPVLTATISLPPEAASIAGGMIQKGRDHARIAAAGAGGGPHVSIVSEFEIVPAPGGGMPMVTAMAINTKGTGATNGRMLLPAVQKHAINTKGTGTNNGRMTAPACDTRPSPSLTLTGSMRATAPTATCALSDDGASAMVSVPLSSFGADAKPYRGHVTLMKRGGDTVAAISGGAVAGIVVASCSATGRPDRANWDLAVSKK